MTIRKLVLHAALAATFLIPAQTFAAQGGAAPKKAAAKAPEAPAPSAKDIADAKAKGLVWANLNTKVFHKDGRYYGTTKNGKFMTEAEALKAGYKAAQEGAAGKKKAETKPATPAKK